MSKEKVYKKGYKAFKAGMICEPEEGKPFQFAENTVFEEPEAKVCEKGFHFCDHPLSVLDYYPLFGDYGRPTEFAEVEALDKVQTDDNSKFVTRKIKIGKKLSLKAMISTEIELCIEKAIEEGTDHYAQGYMGHAAAQGYMGHAAAQGDWGHASVAGKNAIAAAFGIEGMAKAALNSWIMLAEWQKDENGWHIADVKTAKADGKKIKADTWYKLVNGEFVEVKE